MWPARNRRGTTRRPVLPVAPMTKTFIALALGQTGRGAVRPIRSALNSACDLKTTEHSAAADTATRLRTTSAPFGLPVASVNQPTTEGPANPPRLKTVFTKAIAAAAAGPRISEGARHRNGGT